MTLLEKNKLLFSMLVTSFIISLGGLLFVRNPILLSSLILVGASLGVISLVLIRKR